MVTNQKKIEDNATFWDVEKAGKRLLWRFQKDENGNYKNFKINADDELALKSVLAWVNRQSSGVFDKQTLFAKLYLLQLIGSIRENKTTVFNEFVFVELSNQLSKPIELFYKAFYEDLCSNQLNRLSKANITDAEGKQVIVDYKRFREAFSLEYVTGKLKDQMLKTLHRRSK